MPIDLSRLLLEHNCKFNSVLDVGCGIDRFELSNLAQIYSEKHKFNTKYFFGIDNKCKSRHDIISEFWKAGADTSKTKLLDDQNLNFEHSDIDSTNFSVSGSFDLIIISNVLHFVSCAKAKSVFRYLIKNLTPSGYLYVKVINDNHGGDKENGEYKWCANKIKLSQFVKMKIIDGEDLEKNSYILAHNISD